MRNVYVASAPDFKATKVTKFNEDDGVDVGSVRLSDDGSIVTFVRGSGQNRAGWVANPSHDPSGGDRAVWAAHTDGSGAWRLADITTEPSDERRHTSIWNRRSSACTNPCATNRSAALSA